MIHKAAGTRERIIERNRYNPTPDQQAQAYRPEVKSGRYIETMKMPGDLIIRDNTVARVS